MLLENTNPKMNLIDRNRFALILLFILGIFIIYFALVITYQEQIIALMTDLFGYRYNVRSKAFAGFTIFPFILGASIIIALWTHYQGKISAFEFAPTQIKIQTKKLIIIEKLQVQKIIIVQKKQTAVEMEIKTKTSSYSIYHFDDTFLNMITAYFQLQKADKHEKNYKTKTEKKIFELNKNISL
ncbi:hypothetical protein [Pedobacter ureilyticus]|uniref:Uncharacterized protein n=1 Tax=Pedobacter ureilyticus TaxID=1393051 RepID=A0ABW9J4N1_9SPHI|nr:hypothetical protein [Pedobacter helvus]